MTTSWPSRSRSSRAAVVSSALAQTPDDVRPSTRPSEAHSRDDVGLTPAGGQSRVPQAATGESGFGGQ